MQDRACLGLLCLDMKIVRKVCLEAVGCGRWMQDWACLGLLCLDIKIVRKVCLEFVGCGRWMQDWACLGLLCLDMHVVRKVCLEAVGYRTWMDQVTPRACQRWARRVSSTASHDTLIRVGAGCDARSCLLLASNPRRKYWCGVGQDPRASAVEGCVASRSLTESIIDIIEPGELSVIDLNIDWSIH